MKKYEAPELKINVLEIEDVITVSVGENESPFAPASVTNPVTDVTAQ